MQHPARDRAIFPILFFISTQEGQDSWFRTGCILLLLKSQIKQKIYRLAKTQNNILNNQEILVSPDTNELSNVTSRRPVSDKRKLIHLSADELDHCVIGHESKFVAGYYPRHFFIKPESVLDAIRTEERREATSQ